MAIEQQLTLLETAPDMGRPFSERPPWRELAIPFGDSGYVALYHHDARADVIYVLAFRHMREAGY